MRHEAVFAFPWCYKCLECADAQETAGLQIYAGFVIQHVLPQYVNHIAMLVI